MAIDPKQRIGNLVTSKRTETDRRLEDAVEARTIAAAAAPAPSVANIMSISDIELARSRPDPKRFCRDGWDSRLKIAPGAIAAAIASALLLAPPADATAADAKKRPTLNVTNPNLTAEGKARAPEKEYTREEIRKAEPLKWTPAGKTDKRYLGGGFREKQPAVKRRVDLQPPGLPNAEANSQAQKDFPEQWKLLRELEQETGDEALGTRTSAAAKGATYAAAPVSAPRGTQDVYTSYRGNYWLNQQTAFPWAVVGKLLIDGGGYCTAQSISGAPKNIIVTAAHCVYDVGSGFKAGWTFVPAERNGAAPYGQFRWASARVLTAWTTGGGRRNDIALIRLQNNSAGRPVSYYTGWLGWRQNYPYTRNLHSIGYASNISTAWTSICSAESFYAGCEGDDVLVKGCNMTYGSSGGAWIDEYKPYEVSGYVESVVSGPSCAGAFGQTYVGAHFSNTNFGTLCAAEGGCTTP